MFLVEKSVVCDAGYYRYWERVPASAPQLHWEVKGRLLPTWGRIEAIEASVLVLRSLQCRIDQRPRGCGEMRGRALRSEDARGHVRTIHQEHKLIG